MKKNLLQKFTSVAVALGVSATLVCALSCSGRKLRTVGLEQPADSLPVMRTTNVNSLISDSGIARYRITADEWMVFDKKVPSYWAFEQGLHLEQFDTLFAVEANIDCDTAYYYDKERLWKLMGDVHITNRKGEEFNTELLYWDQDKRRVYSDKRIRIKQPDKVISGKGFDSNESFTSYVIDDIEGVFYVDEDQMKASPQDSLSRSADSLQQREGSALPGMSSQLPVTLPPPVQRP